jgi:ligand-binding sensor domain-containing protein/signal transduction histidine kinase
VLITLLLLAELPAVAPGVDDVRFREFGIAQGLSQATVRAMVQDHQGFIWLGTQDGLNRFDGHQIRVYRHDPVNPHSLSDNNIVSLARDPLDGLWIATQSGGLNHYQPDRDRFIRYRHDANDPNSLASNVIARVMVAPDHTVWVQSETGQLQWLDQESGQFHSPEISTELASGELKLLTIMTAGDLILGHQGRLWQWQPQSGELAELIIPDTASQSFNMAVEGTGSLWVGSETGGVYQFSDQGQFLRHWRRQPASGQHGLIDDQVRSLKIDGGGMVWVGTLAGLSRIDPALDQVRHWHHDPGDPLSLSGARIVSLLEDDSGLIWAGTWTGGASVYDPQTSAFVLVRNRPDQPLSLPGNAVPGVLENPDGTLWIAVLDVGGLVLFDPDRGVLERHEHDPDQPNGLPHRMVGSLLHDGDGLLVGTLGGGLVRLDPASGQFERLVEDPGQDVSRSTSVERLQRDREGTLWVSTIGQGLYRRCAGCAGFEQFYPDPDDSESIAGNEVNGVLETSDGQFWVALRRNGLNRMDRSSGRFERFTVGSHARGLRHNSVTGMLEASDGTLWLGTQGGGVHRLDDNGEQPAFTTIGRAEGLDADAIGEIAEDARGRIWVSTTSGLSRIDPGTLKVENFPFIDGHSGAGFFIGSIDRQPPSHAWFGGVRGLVRVDFEKVDFLIARPQAVLTELLLFNQPQRPGFSAILPRSLIALDRLELNHDQTLVTIEFAAPGTLRYARNLRYSFRLLGLDQEWIETSPERAFATFTSLSPGDYQFEVRASIGPDEWGPVTELPVRVLPPAWLSAQAILLYVLVLALLTTAVAWRVHLGLSRRRQARKEIAASRQRLRMALWGSRDELWEANMADNTLVRENRMDRLSDDDDTAFMTLDEFWSSVHPQDVDMVKQSFLDHVRGKTDYLEAEFRGRGSATGPWRWMLSRGRITERDASGKALLMSGTTRDISRLKHTEEQLLRLNEELESRVSQRTEELESSNQTLQEALTELQHAQRYLVQTEKLAALGGLVAGIAHEINTPLGVGVTAASHLEGETRRFRSLLESDSEVEPTKLVRFAATAEQSCQLILRNLRRADQLVKSFKQVAVDQSSEQRRTFELKSYIDEILTSLHPEIKRTRHEVINQATEGLVFDSYPGALYQILVNLVMNSLTHAFEEDQAGRISIETQAGKDSVVLIYTDNGRGMAEDVAAQMFNPFFTTRRGQGGSGLGLHIVYNLVTQVLRGDIIASTASGQGIRFEITLPRKVSDT